ncbi:hypothetical protein DN536_36710, partial [Burkholderia multivorans]
RAGWKLMYDPAIAVDHYPAERFDDDRRDARSAVRAADARGPDRRACRRASTTTRRSRAAAAMPPVTP